MRYSKRKQKRLIIIGLCSIVFLMCIGYAAFSTVLTINSTSEITSNWDVEITNVRGVNDSSLTYNDAYDKVAPSISEDKHSVTIQTGLLYPGDTRIYEIEVTNKGNINSEVSTKFENIINDSTIFSFDGVSPIGSDGYDILSAGGSYDSSLLETTEPFDLPAFTNNKRYLYLMIKFKDSVTSQPKDLNPSVTLSISAVQKSDNTPIVPKGEETVLVGGVEVPVVTSGDGLYYDDNTDEYYYRGGKPNNYIEFNNEVWRIMSINLSGNLKIIKDDRIDLTGYSGVNTENSFTGRFEGAGLRTTGYCGLGSAPTNGCNAWASMDYFVNNGSYGAQYNLSGPVTADSELNTYLNSTYKSSLSDLSKVQSGMTWNIGPAGAFNDTLTVSQLEDMERSYTWTGDIALATKSEYLRANSNDACLTASALYATKYTDICRNTNYLWSTKYSWLLLSPYLESTLRVFLVYSPGFVEAVAANSEHSSVLPVLFLKTNINLTGNGGSSSEDMFKIAS